MRYKGRGQMIRSYKGKYTEAVAAGKALKGFPSDLVASGERKLRYLSQAGRLEDLRSPPGNRLERLSGDREGQHSIRINDQWRICFRWTAAGVEDVEIVDYH
jgi:proteic killer suppression protein